MQFVLLPKLINQPLKNAKKIITSSIEKDKFKNKLDLSSLNIYHKDEFDIQNAMDLKSGIYLLQKSNITSEKNRDNV